MAKAQDCIFISALEKTNLEEFRKEIYDRIRELHVQRFPYNDFLYPIYDDVDWDNIVESDESEEDEVE